MGLFVMFIIEVFIQKSLILRKMKGSDITKNDRPSLSFYSLFKVLH